MSATKNDMTVAQESRSVRRDVRSRDARGRRPNWRRRHLAGSIPIAVNFAPMIDVTFLLLIFFLVTTTFERAEGILASKMPQDTGAPSVALPLSPIVVRLAQTGPDHDDVTIRVDRIERELRTVEELVETLQAIHQQPAFDTETPVVIIAGDDVRWDHVVACWNAALRAGCERIAFGEP